MIDKIDEDVIIRSTLEYSSASNSFQTFCITGKNFEEILRVHILNNNNNKYIKQVSLFFYKLKLTSPV